MIISMTVVIEFGFLAIGIIGGLRMVGKGCGFQAAGNGDRWCELANLNSPLWGILKPAVPISLKE
jgi:hypothetical protein